MRVIISGGGTGGHIFPAIAIADEIKKRNAESKILFVGAKGRMEMERVPKAGYPIKGLWISGIQRRLTWKNLMVPIKIVYSLWQAWNILRRCKPQIVVGVGGYASGPLLRMAAAMGIPSLIQEQNSYAGLTNRLLGGRVDRICVAYGGMDVFFPPGKITLTGNPIRQDILDLAAKKEAASSFFEWGLNKKTLLILGGSLGARSLNEAVVNGMELIRQHPDCLVLWQVGGMYEDRFRENNITDIPNLRFLPFIDRMDYAYALADVVISRAGALTISEICVAKIPAILVPSPNVAEDHQTKNARKLADEDAAILVTDSEAPKSLIHTAFQLMEDGERRKKLAENMAAFGKPDAAERIVNEMISLVK